MKALFAGSFDPVTTGHLNLIMRASRMFEEVVVAVMINPAKKTALSKEKRMELLKKCTGHLNNVKIVEEDGLTVDAAWNLNTTTSVCHQHWKLCICPQNLN